ncbi:MAG: S8 family serine peptidase [Planctomycetaceae bacterium]|nr:S8 family serine peptidase [Planctomycetaceae bacterium]
MHRVLSVVAATGLASGVGVADGANAKVDVAVTPDVFVYTTDGPDDLEFHPRQLLVRFAAGTAEVVRQAAVTAVGGRVMQAYTLVPDLYNIEVPEGGLEAAHKALNAHPAVRYAELDMMHRAMAETQPYGIGMVNAAAAWSGSRGSGARVAVLDTGVDLSHPDLPAPAAAESFISGQPVQDGNRHGTHCSGTVLAVDNDEGVIGVAPQATLLIGKVLSDGGSGSTSGIIAGIQWAVTNNAHVISMSLGGGGFDQAFADACAAAVSAGVVVVAAAGNSNTDVPSYPASYPGVISVAAIDSSQNRASFSNFGPTISLSAPGVGVLSTVPSITASSLTSQAEWAGVTRPSAILSGSGTGDVLAEVVFCGFGGTAADFPASVSGKVAHIRRGGTDANGNRYSFRTKVNNAVAAGAIAVIISNDAGGLFNGALNQTVSIPVVGVSQTDGDDLQARPAGTFASVSVTAAAGPLYANLSGTSMACPHVAGVAALLVSSVGPGNATPAQIRQAMEVTATDLGTPGRDDLFGHGLVNAAAARTWLLSNVTPPCVADVVSVGGQPPRDGALTGDDFVAFINAFAGADTLADVASVGGGTPGDGTVTGDDFVAYINAFATGCP